jgi:glutaredoxin
MYSASWCGVCDRARRYFRAHAIAFREYDVETTAKGRLDYRRLRATGVPVILVGEKRLDGFSERSFERLYE